MYKKRVTEEHVESSSRVCGKNSRADSFTERIRRKLKEMFLEFLGCECVAVSSKQKGLFALTVTSRTSFGGFMREAIF